MRPRMSEPSGLAMQPDSIAAGGFIEVGGGMKEESPARWAAGAAAPAPAARRRENLRSASFRDYAAGVTPAPKVKAARRWRGRGGLGAAPGVLGKLRGVGCQGGGGERE